MMESPIEMKLHLKDGEEEKTSKMKRKRCFVCPSSFSLLHKQTN